MSVVVHGERGTITVPATTVAALVRSAAEAVPGARVRRRRRIEVQIDDGRVRVSIEVAARYGTTLPDVARAVQERVQETLERMFGVTVDSVDVAIEEVE